MLHAFLPQNANTSSNSASYKAIQGKIASVTFKAIRLASGPLFFTVIVVSAFLRNLLLISLPRFGEHLLALLCFCAESAA